MEQTSTHDNKSERTTPSLVPEVNSSFNSDDKDTENKESISSHTTPTVSIEVTPNYALPGLHCIQHLEEPMEDLSPDGSNKDMFPESRQHSVKENTAAKCQTFPKECIEQSETIGQHLRTPYIGMCVLQTNVQPDFAILSEIRPDCYKSTSLSKTDLDMTVLPHQHRKDSKNMEGIPSHDCAVGAGKEARTESWNKSSDSHRKTIERLEKVDTGADCSSQHRFICNEPEDLQASDSGHLREATFGDCKEPGTEEYTPPELSSDLLLDTPRSTSKYNTDFIEKTWPCSKECGNRVPYDDTVGMGMCSECFEEYVRETTLPNWEAPESTPRTTEWPQQVNMIDPVPDPEPTSNANTKIRQENQAASFCTDTGFIPDLTINQARQATRVTSTSSPTNRNSRKWKNRCTFCHKKVLIGIECRCGSVFCIQHRHKEVHKCNFDYKSWGRQNLMKQNPRVVAKKIRRI